VEPVRGEDYILYGTLLLAEDFNVRTAKEPDYIEHDTDSYVNLPQGYKVDILSIRASQDNHINNYGRLLLQLCSGSGIMQEGVVTRALTPLLASTREAIVLLTISSLHQIYLKKLSP